MRSLLFMLISHFILASLHAQNFTGRIISVQEYARKKIQLAIKDTAIRPFFDTLITTRKQVIAIVEPALFRIYGRKNIRDQRPYETYLLDGYWFICGTLRERWMGGTFEAIVISGNGQILSIKHYR